MPRDHMVKVGNDWCDGFLVGKAAAIADWAFRKELPENDIAFRRLVWSLQQKKYWAAKNPESKARIRAYRLQWARDHRALMNAYARKCKAKLRADPAYRAKEAAEKRAARVFKSARRRAELVYTCVVCGAQWCQTGRIPCRPPKHCSQSCKSRANYVRAKAVRRRRAERAAHDRVGLRLVSAIDRAAEPPLDSAARARLSFWAVGWRRMLGKFESQNQKGDVMRGRIREAGKNYWMASINLDDGRFTGKTGDVSEHDSEAGAIEWAKERLAALGVSPAYIDLDGGGFIRTDLPRKDRT